METTPDPALMAERALKVLKRLADPTEIAGFGHADDEPNNTPEMRARIHLAKRAAQRIPLGLEP